MYHLNFVPAISVLIIRYLKLLDLVPNHNYTEETNSENSFGSYPETMITSLQYSIYSLDSDD